MVVSLAGMMTSDPKELLGAAIRKERESKGVSQEAFAHQCGLHRTYIGSVERGERNISLESVLKIAETLGLKLSELFSKATSSRAFPTGIKQQKKASTAR